MRGYAQEIKILACNSHTGQNIFLNKRRQENKTGKRADLLEEVYNRRYIGSGDMRFGGDGGEQGSEKRRIG